MSSSPEDDKNNNKNKKQEAAMLWEFALTKAVYDGELNNIVTKELSVPYSAWPSTKTGQKHHGVVGQHDDWADHGQNIQERLDFSQTRGSVDFQDQQLALSLFAELSPYSPVRLDLELGWRPTPRDLPPAHAGGDPSLFGWKDAFEDLLSVSSARPMMNLGRRQLMNKVLANTPLSWRPSWLFYNRLLWQGLDEAYFPVYNPPRYRSPRTMEEWVAMRKVQRIPADDWSRALASLKDDVTGATDDWKGWVLSSWFHRVEDGAISPVPLAMLIKDLLLAGFNRDESADTEEDLYMSNINLKNPQWPDEKNNNNNNNNRSKVDNAPGLLSALFRIVGRSIFGIGEKKEQQQQQQQMAQGSSPKGLNPVSIDEVQDGDLVEVNEYETEDGGKKRITKLARKIPGGEQLNLIKVERTNKHGNEQSTQMFIANSKEQGGFDSPSWKEFYGRAVGKSDVLDEKKKDS